MAGLTNTMKPQFIDNQLYFAKATMPVGNPWRTAWMTKEQAIERARTFCQQWAELGVKTEACIFYRDGSIYTRVTGGLCEP